MKYLKQQQASLEVAHQADLIAQGTEILINVAASGVNRADLLQLAGKYPPPAGVSDIIGLEVAGTVLQSPAGSQFNVGDKVMALLAGGGYAQQVCASKRNAGRIAAVTTEMLRRMGGLERFAADWKEAVDAAMAAGKLHLVVRSGCALVDLLRVADELQRQEIREMSDIELQRAMLHQTITALKQRPELVLHAAAELGWTVTPPDGGEDSTW